MSRRPTPRRPGKKRGSNGQFLLVLGLIGIVAQVLSVATLS